MHTKIQFHRPFALAISTPIVAPQEAVRATHLWKMDGELKDDVMCEHETAEHIEMRMDKDQLVS